MSSVAATADFGGPSDQTSPDIFACISGVPRSVGPCMYDIRCEIADWELREAIRWSPETLHCGERDAMLQAIGPVIESVDAGISASGVSDYGKQYNLSYAEWCLQQVGILNEYLSHRIDVTVLSTQIIGATVYHHNVGMLTPSFEDLWPELLYSVSALSINLVVVEGGHPEPSWIIRWIFLVTGHVFPKSTVPDDTGW